MFSDFCYGFGSNYYFIRKLNIDRYAIGGAISWLNDSIMRYEMDTVCAFVDRHDPWPVMNKMPQIPSSVCS